MKLMNTKEAALFWGVCQRHVCRLCAAGRVKGAVKIKGRWFMHPMTSKPFDRRFKAPRTIMLYEIMWGSDDYWFEDDTDTRRQGDCPYYSISYEGLIVIKNTAERYRYMRRWGLAEDEPAVLARAA